MNPNKTIKKFMLKCQKGWRSLPCFKYKQVYFDYHCIKTWELKQTDSNIYSTKVKIAMIIAIINNKVPQEYYRKSLRWKQLKIKIQDFLKRLNPGIHIIKQKCIYKGLRHYHYDFTIILNNAYTYNLEFKFNIHTMKDKPQYVSPMKPSQYLTDNYEEYYYDNYLHNLCLTLNIPKPNREEYLKTIHTTNPECVKALQNAYYKGSPGSSQYTGSYVDMEFYLKAKTVSQFSISSFIEKVELKQEKLSNYLIGTQSDKAYMIFYDGKFHKEDVNLDNYQISSYIKHPKLSRFDAVSKSGRIIKILFRWKNGNGIAYPAFQIY